MAAMARGAVQYVRDEGVDEPLADGPMETPVAKSEAVTHHGFNLHASVTVAADDDLGRERLCRYGLRPAFAVARLRFLQDGQVSYVVKNAGRGRAKVRVMTPMEALARLCALIPPPRFPLTRFRGVLAPRHKLRSRVVPHPPEPRVTCTERRQPATSATAPERAYDSEPSMRAPLPKDARTLASSTGHVALAPNVLSLAHWERIRGGLLYAASANVNWATLLPRRTCCRRTVDSTSPLQYAGQTSARPDGYGSQASVITTEGAPARSVVRCDRYPP